jgi:hypothetical protein
MRKLLIIAAFVALATSPAGAVECHTIGAGQFVGPGWQQCAEMQQRYDAMERERRDTENRMRQMERDREADRYNMEMQQRRTRSLYGDD